MTFQSEAHHKAKKQAIQLCGLETQNNGMVKTSRVPRAIVLYVRGREKHLKFINEFNAAYYQGVLFF